MNPFTFYDCTPYEISIFLDGKSEKHIKEVKEIIELVSIAVKVGYINANSNKNYTVFEKESENKKEKTIEETEKEVEELRKTFSI